MITIRNLTIFTLSFLVFLFSTNTRAAEPVLPENMTMGVRAGTSFNTDEDMTVIDIFSAWELSWNKEFSSGWKLVPALDVTLSYLNGGGDKGARIGSSIDLFFVSPEKKLSFIAGLGAGVFFEEDYGELEFGGLVCFLGQLGVNYWFTKNFSAGYRFHHQSNGSLYDTNPGMNLHQLEVRFSL